MTAGSERIARVAAALAVGALVGCAHYRARPLASEPNLAAGPADLKVDVSQLHLAPLAPHRFDPAAGLDPTDVAILAVLNSPDLKAKRAAAGVAAAQAFSAGLLPDPQLSASIDVPDHPASATTAWALIPAIDVLSLVTRPASRNAAKDAQKQADLDLLWSEWSTAQQARTLAVTILADEAKGVLLARIDGDLSVRLSASTAAWRRGDLPSSTFSADQAAKIDADSQLGVVRAAERTSRGELNALIGLAPNVRLDLVLGAPAAPPSPVAVNADLRRVARRRPDLLALQAGYHSQDADLRRAILAQFPLISLGYNRQQDNTGILSNGLAATLVIPIFNRNRGDIRIQEATREKLAEEYQARLDQTVANVTKARAELDADEVQAAKLAAELPSLERTMNSAEPRYAHGDISSDQYLALEEAVLRDEASLADLRLASRLALISLDTLLFIPPGESS
ncbi:MAG: TolC family protein [Caulobacteraceae bacterium]